jgi:alkyl sulfatase BDS1-like metallo-beta-lactamase superfamily hydrolase
MAFKIRTPLALAGLMLLSASIDLAALPPSASTRAFNDAVLSALPFEDQADFENARKGLIAQDEALIVKDELGRTIWDMTAYDFLNQERPASVNPSLWRQAQLNAIHGLFKVTDRIYQIRGYDLSNMTLIEGDTGWIIVDPLTTVETATAAMALVDKTLGKRPVKAIISTHSHGDHFGGVRAIADEAALASGEIRYIVPKNFTEESVSENVIAGNAMIRRVGYMFGLFLPRNSEAHVDTGLGKALPPGRMTLLPPTDIISETGQTLTVDGVDFEFQMTPHAEAPAEFLAEEVNGVMHNLYTLRGAKTRDTLIWVRHLNETIRLFKDRTDLVFGSHHWPRWGREVSFDYVAKQRDMYRYLHDQTVRLMNHGQTPLEIAAAIRLPESLGREFYNRDYYGTVSHNVRAVYNFYLGYFDGVPANLNPLPPQEAGQRYVDLAGGAEALLQKARKAIAAGDYRWAAQLTNHLVFADPEHAEARNLLAAAYEQMGYQAESGPWRDIYLTGAQELRHGVFRPEGNRSINTDMLTAIPTPLLFDFLAVRFNPDGADDVDASINFRFPDTGEKIFLSLQNSVLNNVADYNDADASLTVTIDRAVFNKVISGQSSFAKEVVSGNVKIWGNPIPLYSIFSRLDSFDQFFNIVTP